MTPRKVSVLVGRRPDLDECISGWYRVHGPSKSRCDFDRYCAGVVEAAFNLSSREVFRETQAMEALLLHYCATGRISGFKIGTLAACSNGHDEMWQFCVLRFAFHELRTRIKLAIWQAMPFG